MDKTFVIEEIATRSGNGRLYRGTLESLKKRFGLNETKSFPYKWDFVYIYEPTTIKELIRALNKLAKYDSWHKDMQYKLAK